MLIFEYFCTLKFTSQKNLKYMENDEIEEIFSLLRKAGWNPQLRDDSRPHFENLVQAGTPRDPGEPYSEYYLPRDVVNARLRFTMDVRGDSMKGANIEDGDTLGVVATVNPSAGDIVIAEINREITVKAFFEDEDGQRWLVPFNEDFDPIKLTEEMDVRIIGRVEEVTHRVRQNYRDCQRIVNRSKAKRSTRQRPTKEAQEQAIRKVASLVTSARMWYAVYRVLIDAESELVHKNDFEGFCELVVRLVPEHKHLPTVKGMRSVAVLSFDKPVHQWDERNAPVAGKRFFQYKKVAEETALMLDEIAA